MSRNRPSFGAWEHPTSRREKEPPIWPFIFALACLIVLLFVQLEHALGQAAYDQINAGQYSCGSC
ncbi:MAG: hypothetical protein EP341_09665 [Sphingomonadales bacterium]|nr:MAG: hypothetical protein EP341_09665 [Sphingomonadales bacterium]